MQYLSPQQVELVALPIAELLKIVLDPKMQRNKKKYLLSVFFSSVPVSAFLPWFSLGSSCQRFPWERMELLRDTFSEKQNYFQPCEIGAGNA